jgi:NADH-quinone oxidoreductase subunit C
MLTLAELHAEFGLEIGESTFRDNRRFHVPAEKLLRVMTWLKESRGFDMLVDVTAVDYLDYPQATDRYHVVYLLLSLATKERLVIKVALNPPEIEVPTMYHLWRGADWMEREVYDMFGITFAGHPDHRRILMPEEFTAFPLRKDYPRKGFGERHNFPVLTRAES